MKIKINPLPVLMVLFVLSPILIFGQEQEPAVIEIWEGEIPFLSPRENAPVPTISCYPASTDKPHTAVIVSPGGGYRTLAMKREGDQVAKAFNEAGISAYVLRYRLGSEGNRHPAMIADIQQTIALLRKNAREWNLDPDKIGVIGFSAGGHLSATAATYQGENYSTLLRVSGEKYNVRPNFALLVYPVISMEFDMTHFGSRIQLLGSGPSPELVSLLSCEKNVNESTPPVFLVHAENDIVVSVKNSMVFYNKLQEKNVPSELFLYKEGGHNFSLRKKEWFIRCLEWLKELKFITNTE